MRKILKFPLDGLGHTKINTNFTCVPLHVGMQGTQLCIWMECTRIKESQLYEFSVYGTGWDIPENEQAYMYCGTAVESPPGYVYHVYMK